MFIISVDNRVQQQIKCFKLVEYGYNATFEGNKFEITRVLPNWRINFQKIRVKDEMLITI